MTDLVLVTGLSGFIASHVTAGLLKQGYAVRGTVRNKIKGERVAVTLADSGVDTSNLELFEADLGKDAGWKDAVKNCRFVQHIASPFPLEAPSNREALVADARGGAMRVIEQALGAGAERVIMTSSMVAMMGQPGRGDHMLVSESDWSNPDWRPLTAYPVSKTRAERAIWDYANAQNVKDRVTTICPGLVFGPDTYNLQYALDFRYRETPERRPSQSQTSHPRHGKLVSQDCRTFRPIREEYCAGCRYIS